MIYGVYAIKDAKTSYLPLQTDFNDASAIRNFAHAVATGESIMKSHPNDYQLVKLGTYDLETGVIVPCHEVLAEASDYAKE